MGWAVLLVLVDVAKPGVGCLVVLFGHPWVACTSGAKVLLVSVHFLVEETGNPSLGAGDFHNGNIA